MRNWGELKCHFDVTFATHNAIFGCNVCVNDKIEKGFALTVFDV